MNFFKKIGTCCYTAYHWQRMLAQVIRGIWKITSLELPIVSIFGGARFLQNDPYAMQANKLAQMFVEANVSVLTGGGPGIMEAASCGAVVLKGGKGKGSNIGINVPGLEGRNHCATDYIEVRYFFAKKYLLTHFSSAFIVFPGGFGTLDELCGVLTLIQTNKMPRLPIILIGVDYWTPMLEWLKNQALAQGTISNLDIELFVITDDIKKAFSLAIEIAQVVTPPIE